MESVTTIRARNPAVTCFAVVMLLLVRTAQFWISHTIIPCSSSIVRSMGVDFTQLLVLSASVPKPANFEPSYGTAGFRAVATVMASTVLRCGALAAIRSLHCHGPCGLMITASHNPEPDNGVKLIESDGEYLIASWEPYATAISRAATADALALELSSLLEGCTQDSQATVLLGYDTRPSSVELARLAEQAAVALGACVINCGLVTTPQLHFMVAQHHLHLPATELAYFEELQQGFSILQHGNAQSSCHVMVDCANGIGAPKLAKLAEFTRTFGLELELVNVGDGKLNDESGADYVQKEKKAPKGMTNVMKGHRCCSIDGDADRMVYFHQDKDSFHLLDGDKIAILAAIFIHDLLKELPSAAGVMVGVVQTAYANGASTRYIQQHLGLRTVCTPTGVKHLHAAAKQFDIAIYFEANGHGTVLFSPAFLAKAAQVPGSRAAEELLALARMVNQRVGDALSNILLVETILRRKGWSIEDWINLYHDLPSRQLKVTVADRAVITTTNAETTCVTPAGLQAAIDAAVAAVPQGRAFVRTSGTEDVVRVYAEAAEQSATDALAREVSRLVHRMAGGTGPCP